MDDIFKFLIDNCPTESLIDDIHTLVHADDTLVISQERNKFIHKCNTAIQFFANNKMKVNVSKSFYLIINPGALDTKSSLPISHGHLNYTNCFSYLGIFISDNGHHRNDIKKFIEEKRPTLTVKFQNYINSNKCAPLWSKLNVLDNCVVPCLLYACETWGSIPSELEVLYRTGLKNALSIRQNMNNEIVYIETGKTPLEIRIKKLQLNFWLNIEQYRIHHPDSAIAKILLLGEAHNIGILSFYKSLKSKYTTGIDCEQKLTQIFKSKCINKINSEAQNDPDCRLGTYHSINKDSSPFVPKPQFLLERERILLTRFRTGSHSLQIEIGRFSNTPRQNRLCVCGTNVQSLKHILFECNLTNQHTCTFRNNYSIYELFQLQDIHIILFKVSNTLKIPI